MTTKLRRSSLPADAATAWALLYAATAAFWALGGAGFPDGDGDSEAGDMGSLLVGTTAAGLAAPIATACAVAAVVAHAMTPRREGLLPRRLILAVGWGFTALLILAIPDLGGLLTHGLSRPWGEVYPRWVPRVGGTPIPTAVVVVPAALATILIVTAATSLMRFSLNVSLDRVPEASPDITGWGASAPGLLWLPWGLALAAATYAYWRRRRAASGRPRG